MPIDWKQTDLVFLRKQLEQGDVVLFAGAGFSVAARNAHGQSPPLGKALAKVLAKRASLPYADESLPTVCDTVKRVIGTNKMFLYLRDLYEIKDYDPWYRIVASITWYRIYTINIDDLLQRIYEGLSCQRLETIVCPANNEERDQLFRKLQCIHLHGHVHHDAKGLTFTLSDFAQHTAKPNPWYQSLVDDLYRHTVVFIGTNMEEPQLHHYIALRDFRQRDQQEIRPKSFLVSPDISAIQGRALQSRNIVPIKATTEELFTGLQAQVGLAEFDPACIREKVFPHIRIRDSQIEVDTNVSRYFDHIIPDSLPSSSLSDAKVFFLGGEPTWQNIEQNHDGRREINQELHDILAEPLESFKCVVLHGPAGSGKTTTIMRVAHNLASEGGVVYFAKGMERTDFSGVLRVAAEMAERKGRVFVFVDILTRQIGGIEQAKKTLKSSQNVTLVLADRTNAYFNRNYAVSDLQPVEVRMPNLVKRDVISILARLEEFGFLGVLKGKKPEERVKEFMIRAEKQLLVAMKEATSGKGFDAILSGEFAELHEDAQLAYVICCLVVAKGAPGVYERHLLPSLGTTSFKKAIIIHDLLLGVLVPANQSGSMVKPRHRFIAQWVSNEIAPPSLVYEATKTFLRQISSDIVPNEMRRQSPAFLAYRGMINSEGLMDSLRGNREMILGLYNDLRPYYGDDSLFWLHNGMAYIGDKQLDVAENYLNQSLALKPKSHQTLHQLGILHLMQATTSPNPSISKSKADEGIQILRGQILERGDHDSYPYAAYITYVSRWYVQAGRDLIENDDWDDLKKVASEAEKKYARDQYIRDAIKEMDFSYMSRAVRKGRG